MYDLLGQVTCLCILFIMLGDVLFIMSGNLFHTQLSANLCLVSFFTIFLRFLAVILSQM